MVYESTIALPIGSTVPIAYLRAFETRVAPTGPIRYLHAVRSPAGGIDQDNLQQLERAYGRLLPGFLADYQRWAQRHPFDTILKVPSSANHADPYLNALRGIFRDAADLSACFVKNPHWRAGLNSALQQAIQAITIDSDFDASNSHRIVVVDDSISSGNSVSALIHHLRSRRLPENSQIWLVIPLCLKTLAAAP